MNFKKYINTCIDAAYEAGETLSNFHNKSLNYFVKKNNPRDLVSRLDVEVEKKIKDKIIKKFKNHCIIGEETKKLSKKNHDYEWYIDPLDGTVNFLRQIPIYGISIGLTFKKKPIFGLIYLPATKEILYNLSSKSYYFNKDINIERDANKISDCLCIVAYPGEKGKLEKINYRDLEYLNNKSQGVLRIGSAAMGLAYVITGKADIFIGYDCKSWDIAAGVAIAKAKKLNVYLNKNQKLKNNNNVIIAKREIFNVIKKKIKFK